MNTKMTRPNGLQRVFIGIPVDGLAQRRINDLLNPLEKPHEDIRWVPEKNRHMTLAFIGNVPAPAVENLARCFDNTYQEQSSCHCQMSLLTRFPGPAGRIIALVGKATRPLEGLHGMTLELLKSNALDFDRKKFRPHITVGRISRAKQVRTQFDKRLDIDLRVNKITLYESTLTTSGPIYSPLKETWLNKKPSG